MIHKQLHGIVDHRSSQVLLYIGVNLPSLISTGVMVESYDEIQKFTVTELSNRWLEDKENITEDIITAIVLYRNQSCEY